MSWSPAQESSLPSLTWPGQTLSYMCVGTPCWHHRYTPTSMHACTHYRTPIDFQSIVSSVRLKCQPPTPYRHPPPYKSCVPAPTFMLLLLCNPLRLCNNSNAYISRGWHARLHTHTSMHALLLLHVNDCAITVMHTEDRMKLG